MNPATDAPPPDPQDPDPIPPIQNDERLYRRLLPGWYKAGKPNPIPQRAFMPRISGDPDGLSVNRAALTDIETAASRPDTGAKLHLVEFDVASVHRLGLSVLPKPLKSDRSHAVIPELNSIDRLDREKESKMEEWAIALRDCARLAYEPPSK